MSSQSNTFNKNFETAKFSKIKRLEESKIESYVLRKHLNYQIPNCFIQKDFENVSSIVSPLKQNIKSNNEELQKLLIEINHVEEKLRELELSKKLKQFKIQDLRKIIERIADEDSFDNNSHCLFNSRMSKCFMAREKCQKSIPHQENYNQQVTKKQRDNNYLRTNNGDESSCFESEAGDDSAGAGEGKTADICGKRVNCSLYCSSTSHCYLQDNTLENCLLFWQEHLSLPRGVLKQ